MISGDIKAAAALLARGEVVAIPTETVYGLAGNIFDEKAVRSIYSIKGRPHFNPLIVHIPSVERLSSVAAYIPPDALKLARRFWPGPLTLVLPKQDVIPNLVTGGKDTVAVRVPDHPVALALLNSIDFPLAAPSANPFGSLSPTRAEHVEAGLGNKVPLILDGGACQKGIESTIIGFVEDRPVVYRLGSISLEDIESVIGPVGLFNKQESGPPAPGMLDKHYSPNTPLIVCNDPWAEWEKHDPSVTALLVLQCEEGRPEVKQVALSGSGDLEEAARNLFDKLHEMDTMGLQLIIAERMPEVGMGRSINDRLERAAKD